MDVCKEHLASMINGSQLSGKFVARLISVMISEQDFKCSTSSYDIFSTAGTKFNFPWDAAVLVQAVKVKSTYIYTTTINNQPNPNGKIGSISK